MTGLGRAAMVGGALLGCVMSLSVGARAEAVPVLGATRASWLPALVNEMRTAGLDPDVGDQRGGGGVCGLHVKASPARIDVLARADGGAWVIDDAVPLGRTDEAHRRAIVRVVEILRARCAWTRGSESLLTVGAPEASDDSSPAATSTLVPPPQAATHTPTAAVVAVAEIAGPAPPAAGAVSEDERVVTASSNPALAPSITVPTPATRSPPALHASVVAAVPAVRDRRFSVGVTAGLLGAPGGLGVPAAVGIGLRYAAARFSLWTRAEVAINEGVVNGDEGSATIRPASLSIGAGWLPWSSARVSSILGGEAAGFLVRARGEGQPGFRGQSVSVPGASVGPMAGVRILLGDRLAAIVQARAGVVAWEPTVTFVGRPVAAWHGPLLTMTAELAWRF